MVVVCQGCRKPINLDATIGILHCPRCKALLPPSTGGDEPPPVPTGSDDPLKLIAPVRRTGAQSKVNVRDRRPSIRSNRTHPTNNFAGVYLVLGVGALVIVAFLATKGRSSGESDPVKIQPPVSTKTAPPPTKISPPPVVEKPKPAVASRAPSIPINSSRPNPTPQPQQEPPAPPPLILRRVECPKCAGSGQLVTWAEDCGSTMTNSQAVATARRMNDRILNARTAFTGNEGTFGRVVILSDDEQWLPIELQDGSCTVVRGLKKGKCGNCAGLGTVLTK